LNAIVRGADERGKRRHDIFASIAAAFILIGVSVYFFLLSVSLVNQESPRVTASLLSMVIGFASLSASVSLIRTALLARSADLILQRNRSNNKR